MSFFRDLVAAERRKWEKVDIDRVNHIGRACIDYKDYGGGHNKYSLFDALPIVAVVGDQSSGKSALLESIVGCAFYPKTSRFFPRIAKRFGFVTRTPLVVHLIKIPPHRYMCVEFSHLPQQFFYDLSEIRQEIDNQTNRISLDPNPSPFHIFIHSPDAVDHLTLIDLPALTNAKGVVKMVKAYINKPTCIILAVSPAGQDLAKSVAMKLAKEVDPSGDRTIGVLTKLDLLDRRTNALDVLEGDYHHHPWVGVAIPPHHTDLLMYRYPRPSPVPNKVCSEVRAKLLSLKNQKALDAPLAVPDSLLDKLQTPKNQKALDAPLAVPDSLDKLQTPENQKALDAPLAVPDSLDKLQTPENQKVLDAPLAVPDSLDILHSPVEDPLLLEGTRALDLKHLLDVRHFYHVLGDHLDHPCECGLANSPPHDTDMKTMYPRRRMEQDYFATSPHYAHLADTMGSQYLAKLLSNRLESVIEGLNIDSLITKGIGELEADPKHDRLMLELYETARSAQYTYV